MYLLPRLRKLAPEHYDALRQMPVAEWRTWREAWRGANFTYACQDFYLERGRASSVEEGGDA